MNVRFNRSEMAEALSVVRTVAAARTPKEVLKCVHLEAHSDFLMLSATDLEVGIRFAVHQVEVNTTGETLVLADTLSRIIGECNDDAMTLERQGAMLHIRGVDSHFQVVTQEPEDFPVVPQLEGAPDYTISLPLLKRLVEWTMFSAARESTRYAINGVLFELEGDRLTLVATDGRRLSCGAGEVSLEGDARENGSPTSVIVPVKALSLLRNLAVTEDALAAIKTLPTQILVRVGPTTISSTLVEGRFPKYRDVIPTDCDQVLELSTTSLQSALRRAALLTNEESKGVRLSIEDNRLTVSARAPEQGEATIAVAVDYKGAALEIGFNPVFLLDALKAAHTDTIEMALKDANRPGIIRLGDDLLYVVMPVSLT
jgi:DNA polymerase-3 subunit beta